MDTLRIATRKSPLALWQAAAISRALTHAHPGLTCELVPMSTQGDIFLEARLTEVGGKNMFVKELERAILAGDADFAVHSMKDVTAQLPPELSIAVMTAREDPRDAFVSNSAPTLAALPLGARIGTASSRRQCQLLATRPDLQVGLVRGNVNTRLAKLDAGEFDALILAASGLLRLGFGDRIRSHFEPEEMLPSAGQGVMGIECREDNGRLLALLSAIANPQADAVVRAERAVIAALGGGCHAPMAAFAQVEPEGTMRLRALVGSLDGTRLITVDERRDAGDAEALSAAVAQALLDQGARALLDAQ
jgi:hydroxymethylbilane synthase